MKRSISVVIPVYRSGPILDALYARLRPVLDALTDSWEVILIDDASNDGTFEKMVDLYQRDKRVKLVRFARNTGQQHATLCGLQRATGDLVFTLDDDLQNPPEEMPKFLAKIDAGYDLVIGRIASQKRHGTWRNISSWAVQKLVSTILGKPKDLALSSYRCMTQRVARAIGAYNGAHAYLPALMFASVPIDRIANVDVSHDERAVGGSTYTLRKLIKLSSYLLINHSYIPLRVVTAWGFILSVVSLLFAAKVMLDVMLFGHAVAGWPSLAVLVSFLSGNILLFMGVIGEYVGRLVEESSRPRQFPIFEERP